MAWLTKLHEAEQRLKTAHSRRDFAEHLKLAEQIDKRLEQTIKRLMQLKRAKRSIGLGPEPQKEAASARAPVSGRQQCRLANWGQLRRN